MALINIELLVEAISVIKSEILLLIMLFIFIPNVPTSEISCICINITTMPFEGKSLERG